VVFPGCASFPRSASLSIIGILQDNACDPGLMPGRI
jgi:hypothetical protein